MKKRVVGLGEALFDLLPEGPILGGAPLNGVVHAVQLSRWRDVELVESARPLLEVEGVVASRVGDDALGDSLCEALRGHGVDCRWIQRDAGHGTGVVEVTIQAGQPSYRIVEGAAWDFMEWNGDWEELAATSDAICFGSLAQRHRVSRETIQRFVREAEGSWRLFDLNLRSPYLDREVVEWSGRAANLGKCNDEELGRLAVWFDLPDPLEDWCATAVSLKRLFGWEGFLLTRGAEGCTYFQGEQIYQGRKVEYPWEEHADTVGAGDATSAALLVGLLSEWSGQAIVDLANRAGAFVASRPGATPRMRE